MWLDTLWHGISQPAETVNEPCTVGDSLRDRTSCWRPLDWGWYLNNPSLSDRRSGGLRGLETKTYSTKTFKFQLLHNHQDGKACYLPYWTFWQGCATYSRENIPLLGLLLLQEMSWGQQRLARASYINLIYEEVKRFVPSRNLGRGDQTVACFNKRQRI